MPPAEPHSAEISDGRPNIVLIVVDEWRAQAFGHAGDANAHTPALDRLAAESLVFDQAVSGHSVCCPARASFMTGQYPLRHGVFINDVQLETEDTTLAEAFVKGGYSTAYIGKWHLYGSPEGCFERREQFVPPEARLGFQYWKAGECTHDYNHSAYFDQDDPSVRYWPGYDAYSQTEDAIHVLGQERDQPLFLMLSFGPPHFPLGSAPSAHQQAYSEREIGLRPNVPVWAREQASEDLRGYYAHIAAIDECVGRIMTAAADSNTVVVFTSDHGDMLWSQGLEYKLVPWEESVRVPLFIRIPGRAPEHRQALFNSPDLMPTMLGLAGIEVPAAVQGVDLLKEEGPASAFLNAPVAFSSLRRCGFDGYRGVRTHRYTYVRTTRGPWLLYDNLEDPHQLVNRLHDPAYASVRAELEGELRGWLDRLGDEFLEGSEYVRRAGLEHYFEVNEPLGFCEGTDGSWRSTNPRGRNWSIDTQLSRIGQDPQARKLLEQHAPALAQASPVWNQRHSPRIAAMADPTCASPEQLAALDAALGALPPRDLALRQDVADAALPPNRRLLPALV
jgi:arylsulfatase A-like enzyme